MIFLFMAGTAFSSENLNEWEKRLQKALAPTFTTSLAESKKVELTIYLATPVGTAIMSAKFKTMEKCQEIKAEFKERENVVLAFCREKTRY